MRPRVHASRRHFVIPLVALGVGVLGPVQANELQFDGSLHLDYAAHRADRERLDDGWLVRRAKFGLEGKLGTAWSFEASYDFADTWDIGDNGIHRDKRARAGIDDVELTWHGWRGADVSLGQYKVPFGLEELGSSNQLTFIERSLATNAFTLSRRMGAGFSRAEDHYTLTAMAFGDTLDGDERGHGVATRATLAPVRDADHVLHLGAALVVEDPRQMPRFSTRPESGPTDEKFVDTGRIADVDRIRRTGFEAAWQSGPLLLQSEWQQARVTRNAEAAATFGGWYVGASWFPAGQTRTYRHGRFKGPSDVRGAWEMTARISRVDLDHRDVRGGTQRNVTLGVNYYANEHLRIMANLIAVTSQQGGVADNPGIFLLRAQLQF